MAFTELKELNSCWRSLAEKKPLFFRKGHVFDESADVFLILKGRIQLVASTPDGEEKIIWFLKDGCIFNETPAFVQLNPESAKRVANAHTHFSHVCASDSRIGCIPVSTMFEEGRKHPELWINLCQSFALKLSLLSENIVATKLTNQRTRVFRFLANRIVPDSAPSCIIRDMSFIDMANLLGMHRISLYRILEDAKKEGIIDFTQRKKKITILDPVRFFHNTRG